VVGAEGAAAPPKFWAVGKLSEIFLSENFHPKMQNLGRNPLFLKNVRTKLEF